MKRIALLIIPLLAAIACSKQGPALYSGYYSFKTGGTLEISGTVHDRICGTRDTSFLRHLVAESGQMHILHDNGDEMIVTMNITGGSPVVFNALYKDGDLILSPTRRMVAIFPDGAMSGESFLCDMMVSGSGHRYDNMIIFKLEYAGDYSHKDMDGTVSESMVDCIATQNE